MHKCLPDESQIHIASHQVRRERVFEDMRMGAFRRKSPLSQQPSGSYRRDYWNTQGAHVEIRVEKDAVLGSIQFKIVPMNWASQCVWEGIPNHHPGA
jgi:hypothetical protein